MFVLISAIVRATRDAIGSARGEVFAQRRIAKQLRRTTVEYNSAARSSSFRRRGTSPALQRR